MKSKTTPDRDVGSSDSSASVLRDFNAWRRDECDFIEYPHTAQLLGEAIDAAVSALEPWLDAKDAPEEKTEVLAAYFGAYQPCCGFIVGKRFFPYREHAKGSEPFTHWMRIPSLPNPEVSHGGSAPLAVTTGSTF